MIYQPTPLKTVTWRKWLLRGLFLVIGFWMAAMIGLSAAIHLYGKGDGTRSADVIIVLGAGLLPDNSPGPALIRRSNHAAELWQQGVAPAILCTGGLTSKTTLTEAAACEGLLRAYGVPQNAIILEDRSLSTEENAIYSLDMMRQHGWKTAVLVSDSYHMLRGRWLFGQKGIPVYISPVPASEMPVGDYVVAVGRELIAFNWQVFKQILHLPYTSVSLF